MKKIIKHTLLIFALPVLLQAQYTGGDGSGDTYISLTNVHLLVNKIESETPAKYELYQNCPNPFNSTSNFKFEIAKLGNAKIVVYDIMGREVQTLVNESLKPGTYEVMFDGSMLNSGVYFYKLETENRISTKKMLLLK